MKWFLTAVILVALCLAALEDLRAGLNVQHPVGSERRGGREMLARLISPGPEEIIADKWQSVRVPEVGAPRKGLAVSTDRAHTKSDLEIQLTHKELWCPQYYRDAGMQEVYYARSGRGVDGACHLVQSYLSSAGYAPFHVESPWQAWLAVSFHFKYQYDREQFSADDVYQTPVQFMLNRRGDCEDHAILLTDWLRGLGYDARVASGESDGKGHSWTVLYYEGQTYILEATSKTIPRVPPLAAALLGYEPNYMYSASELWQNTEFRTKNDYSGNHWIKTGEFREYRNKAEEASAAARALRAEGKLDTAIDFIKQSRALELQDDSIFREFGLTLAAQGNRKLGVENLRKAVELDPSNPQNHQALGDILFDLHRFKEARSVFEALLKLTPDSTNALFRLGYSLGELGRKKEAAEAYTEYICRAPKDAVGFNNLGAALQALGCAASAKAAYTQALTIDRNYSLAGTNLRNLGTFQNERGCSSWSRLIASCDERKKTSPLRRIIPAI